MRLEGYVVRDRVGNFDLATVRLALVVDEIPMEDVKDVSKVLRSQLVLGALLAKEQNLFFDAPCRTADRVNLHAIVDTLLGFSFALIRAVDARS